MRVIVCNRDCRLIPYDTFGSIKIGCSLSVAGRMMCAQFHDYIAEQKLKSLIQSHGMTLGATSQGGDWCLKALHPSDPVVQVAGIPDESAVPSLFMNYQTVKTISAQSGSTGTWSFDATLIPHPISFLTIDATDSISTVTTETLNAQIPGTTHALKYANFRSLARRWRLAYMSVTIYQDGPDLANQGTICVAQVPVRPRKMNYTLPYGNPAGNSNQLYIGPHVAFFSDLDRPSFSSSQAMPNAYFNQSKFGAYVPLKLTRTCQDWRSSTDSVATIGYTEGNAANFAEDPTSTSFQQDLLQVPSSNPAVLWPYPGLPSLQVAYDTVASTNANFPKVAVNQSYVTSDLCNDVWGHISARNLAVTTSYSFYIRAGFEIEVLPQSAWSPQAKLSPEHDPLALETYFKIARIAKDAYPADFNDLGKIMGTIADAVSMVSPALNLIMPGLGGMVGKGAEKVKEWSNRKRITDAEEARQYDQPSQAQVDRARKEIAQRGSRNKRSKRLRVSRPPPPLPRPNASQK